MTEAEKVAAIRAEIAKLDPAAQRFAKSTARTAREAAQTWRAYLLGIALASAEERAANQEPAHAEPV